MRYIKGLNDTFFIYGDLGTGFTSQEVTTGGLSADGDGFYVGFTPALFVNFKNSFGLNFNVGGIRYEEFEDNSNFNFNFGQSVGFGISKNFNLN